MNYKTISHICFQRKQARKQEIQVAIEGVTGKERKLSSGYKKTRRKKF